MHAEKSLEVLPARDGAIYVVGDGAGADAVAADAAEEGTAWKWGLEEGRERVEVVRVESIETSSHTFRSFQYLL